MAGLPVARVFGGQHCGDPLGLIQHNHDKCVMFVFKYSNNNTTEIGIFYDTKCIIILLLLKG